jgi:hypothetical protein
MRLKKIMQGGSALRIAGLLLGINMPNDVIRKTYHLISCAFGHLGKTLGLGLILEGVAREVDTWHKLSAAMSVKRFATFAVQHT